MWSFVIPGRRYLPTGSEIRRHGGPLSVPRIPSSWLAVFLPRLYWLQNIYSWTPGGLAPHAGSFQPRAATLGAFIWFDFITKPAWWRRVTTAAAGFAGGFFDIIGFKRRRRHWQKGGHLPQPWAAGAQKKPKNSPTFWQLAGVNVQLRLSWPHPSRRSPPGRT